jgi:sugar O-acyltransferase (sialic acid O-acetyltransferase NeuD family)
MELILYGASYPDTIKIISKINKTSRKSKVIGFLDDFKFGVQSDFLGIPIIGNSSSIKRLRQNYFYFNNVFSSTESREKVTNILKENNCKLTSIIHPSVDIEYAHVGNNVFIHEGVKIGANSRIGNDVSIRFNSIVNHDNVIEDNVFIGPGVTLCGYVYIKKGAYIGAGAIIKENITINENAVVGAGAVVIRDVLSKEKVGGIPARSL